MANRLVFTHPNYSTDPIKTKTKTKKTFLLLNPCLQCSLKTIHLLSPELNDKKQNN